MAKIEFLVEDPSSDYKISENDLYVYAKQIGIDILNEKHLMWIAEEGLNANVPEPWLILSDSKDRIFYSNYETGEKSWLHPLDKEYASLVVQERKKFLNSPLSDCGFESKLSSLSDAPPLSSSGKTTPSSLKPVVNSNTLSERKPELGHFENRRGAKLAPVRLNTLKMPVPPASSKSSGMSFMPKGSSLSKNIRRVNEQQDQRGNQISGLRNRNMAPQEDLNEDLNSDEESKYSYEETDEEMEKSYYDDMNHSDGGSYFSPVHSTNDSPEALDINSLVQLGTKLPPKLERGKLQALPEDQAPSLSLRKAGQPSLLKPLQQAVKKKPAPKNSKKLKKNSDLNNQQDFIYAEEDINSKITALNEEQRLQFESIQKEWAAMLEELEKQEKAKYDLMLEESNKRFEEEQSLIRKENNEKLSELKKQLAKKVEEEENSGEINLVEIRKANSQKLIEEEQKFKQELDSLKDNLKLEMEQMEQKNIEKINEKKKQLDEKLKNEIEEIKTLQETNIKKIEETNANELAMLEEAQKEKITKLQEALISNKDEEKILVKDNNSSVIDKTNIEIEKVQKLLQEENAKYQLLLIESSKIKEDIAAEKEVLLKLEEKNASAQTYCEEIQDEVDKTENELDLLRNEKSALISELNILKDNIKNEKSNLLKEKETTSSSSKKAICVQKGINTDITSLFSRTTQTAIEMQDNFCQIEVETQKINSYSQTHFEISNASCQVEILQTLPYKNENKNDYSQSDNISNSKDVYKVDDAVDKQAFVQSTVANENEGLEVLINKVLENAVIGMNNKIDARLKSIEEQLSSAQKSTDSSAKRTSNVESLNEHRSTGVNQVSNFFHPNGFSALKNSSLLNNATLIKTMPNSKNCSCEVGDVDSCQVMQDVKNSIYRLNDILSSSFVPSLGNTVISGFNQPTSNYSGSVQSFYSQFRQLQEKQRINELKHKLQNESRGQHSRILDTRDRNYSADFTRNDSSGFNHALNSNVYTINSSDDPISRARNLVLREQARSWKQQQQYLSSTDMQGFLPLERNYIGSRSDNISPSPSSRISSGLSEHSSTNLPFLKFEPDPETEYNEWMSRLKSLQDKIRSHKIL